MHLQVVRKTREIQIWHRKEMEQRVAEWTIDGMNEERATGQPSFKSNADQGHLRWRTSARFFTISGTDKCLRNVAERLGYEMQMSNSPDVLGAEYGTK